MGRKSGVDDLGDGEEELLERVGFAEVGEVLVAGVGPIVGIALGAAGAPEHNRPALRFLVVGAALKFGSRPEIELHAFRIGFKPTGNFVFGNVGGPVRREGHVRQMVDVHLIMQNESVIALPPVVADPRFAIDD